MIQVSDSITDTNFQNPTRWIVHENNACFVSQIALNFQLGWTSACDSWGVSSYFSLYKSLSILSNLHKLNHQYIVACYAFYSSKALQLILQTWEQRGKGRWEGEGLSEPSECQLRFYICHLHKIYSLAPSANAETPRAPQVLQTRGKALSWSGKLTNCEINLSACFWEDVATPTCTGFCVWFHWLYMYPYTTKRDPFFFSCVWWNGCLRVNKFCIDHSGYRHLPCVPQSSWK